MAETNDVPHQGDLGWFQDNRYFIILMCYYFITVHSFVEMAKYLLKQTGVKYLLSVRTRWNLSSESNVLVVGEMTIHSEAIS